MILFLIIQNSENFVNINLQVRVSFPDMVCYLKIKKLLSLDITTFCTDYNHQPLHMVFLQVFLVAFLVYFGYSN
jgi:hypothetical protein